MVKVIDRERVLGKVKQEQSVTSFFTGAGTGLVASCVLAPASSVRTAVFIVGSLMICIGWWKRAQCDRKVLAYMESQEKV